ncbi:helix-turn-helix domain-containing protein [Halobacterium sp. KA-6]|jgi:sugar-specific transcriptional regulator TrmB|uniref:helix-turn-helix domain-containing protein n=1 Tax=Halobacterium sp. KA-6 TaxID=2896368 RepID=UPI001E48521E|nr:helix-turn-helix domain-containing protein [Halobacterium sp. KA-6]MCD2203510.1 helix-turn-helix domain-containing protein [Halobacterium sp. KA-6]
MSTRQLPTGVESPRGKLVYLYLSTNESATLDELHGELDVPRITLYSVLKTLRNRGIVEQDGDSYVAARPL